MKNVALLSILFLLVMPALSLAGMDEEQNDYESVNLLKEDFEDEFPPEGWTLQTTNENHTWRQQIGEEDTRCSDNAGGNYVYIMGDSEEPFDEALITPKLSFAPTDEYNTGETLYFYVHLGTFDLPEGTDFTVEYTKSHSLENNTNWKTVWSFQEAYNEGSVPGDQCPWDGCISFAGSYNLLDEFWDGDFWLRFRFHGQSNDYLCMDNILVEYEWEFPVDDDDDDGEGDGPIYGDDDQDNDEDDDEYDGNGGCCG